MAKFLNKILYPIVKLYYFVVKPKTRGVKCIIQFGDEILMVRHAYGHKLCWTLPGGFVKKRETPEEAVKREVKEETDINIKNFLLIGKFFTTSEYRRDTIYCFSTTTNDKNYKIEKKEIAEAMWFPKINLPEEISEYANKTLFLWRKV